MEIHPRVTPIDVSGFGVIWAYLIRGGKTAIIDTGPAEAPEKYIAPALEKLGMTPADIDLILDTHIHFDHTGGNAALQNASNAQIFIHADEAIFLENPELVFDRHVAPTVEVILGKEQVAEEKKRFIEMVQPGPPVTVDGRLKDNDVVELGAGLDLRVLHLPGHSPGSVGFYLEQAGILFAGDSMEGVCEHNGGLPIIDDLDAYQKSLERVQKLPLEVMAHSHPFRSFTIPRSAVMRGGEIKQFLKECLEFAQRLREAAKNVASGFPEKPFSELYDEVVSQLPMEWGLKPTGEMPSQFFSATTLLNCIKQMEQ